MTEEEFNREKEFFVNLNPDYPLLDSPRDLEVRDLFLTFLDMLTYQDLLNKFGDSQ